MYRQPYLVHGETSVVEVAAASVKASLRHAVVNQQKVAQLHKTRNVISKKFGSKFAHEYCIDVNTTYISHLLVRIHCNSVGFWLAEMLTARTGETTHTDTGNCLYFPSF